MRQSASEEGTSESTAQPCAAYDPIGNSLQCVFSAGRMVGSANEQRTSLLAAGAAKVIDRAEYVVNSEFSIRVGLQRIGIGRTVISKVWVSDSAWDTYVCIV